MRKLSGLRTPELITGVRSTSDYSFETRKNSNKADVARIGDQAIGANKRVQKLIFPAWAGGQAFTPDASEISISNDRNRGDFT
jgi:hypothetical protein